ncbi:MAG TPA: P-loop NTPase fold protein [Desulfuromonadales bacterium]|nr:P-loop NTPase fold protein [Desulfuromonadales bacterium]
MSLYKAITDKPIQSGADDLLSIEKYAKALASFISSTDTPITVGLQGEWGTGKTSLMAILKEILTKEQVATSWVNTWEYSMFRRANETTPAVLKGMLDKLEQNCRNSGTWDVGDETSRRVKKVGRFLSLAANQVLAKQTGVDVLRAAEAGGASGENQAEIAAVKQEIAEIIEKLVLSPGNPHQRVVFFVDDLDRIQPGDAVEVLEALKNIFDIPHCIFVLAIDYDVVVKGLEGKFGKKTEENEREFRSFFDKIIQIPFSMPVGAYTMDSFVVDKLRKFGIKIDEDEGRDYAKVIRYTIGSNPRSLKRYLNSFALINEVRAAGEDDFNPAEESDENFALFCLLGIQISYPKVFRLLVQDISFTNWGSPIAGKNGIDLQNVKEQIESFGENDLIDEEWEQVVWGLCQRETYLKSRAFDVLSLLNLLRSRFRDGLDQALEQALEFASITAVDDDQEMKSSAEKGRKIVFEGIGPKLTMLREKGSNEKALEAYERFFSRLFEIADGDNNYRISLAKTGASFNNDGLSKKDRMLVYANNPTKRNSGFAIRCFDSLGDLDDIRNDILKFISLERSDNIRDDPATERYRRSLVLENALPEEIGRQKYLELMDYVVNLVRR